MAIYLETWIESAVAYEMMFIAWLGNHFMGLIFEILLWESLTKHTEALLQVVEIGKGSKVKYELDKTTGLIKV